MLIVSLLITAKMLKQPRCPLLGEWIEIGQLWTAQQWNNNYSH